MNYNLKKKNILSFITIVDAVFQVQFQKRSFIYFFTDFVYISMSFSSRGILASLVEIVNINKVGMITPITKILL